MNTKPLFAVVARHFGFLAALALVGCGSESTPNPGASGQGSVAGAASGSSGSGPGGTGGTGGAGASSGEAAGTSGAGGSAGAAGSAGAPNAGCVVPTSDDQQPLLLSETHCVDMLDPTKPAPGLVPYSVRSPLWSDNATKERFLRVPDGMKIHVLDCAVDVDACKDPGEGGSGVEEGHFELPVGSVLVKNFSIEGKHIETRLLMRRTNSVWKGFSYEWNDAGTEANLLPDDPEGKDKPLGSGAQVWHYPSREECFECHTKFAGRSLGPSTSQLNSDYAYAEGSMNQLDKLEQLGLFDAPPKRLPGYPDPFGSGTLDERARSYIQTNCAICHRPGGEFSTVDMRFSTALADSRLCGRSERDTGLVPEYRILPGDPSKSAMSFRMHALDGVRMPKIGSNVVDGPGSELIDAWISALPANACPPQPPL